MAEEKLPRKGSVSALRDFLESEAAGGILLMLAAAAAMIIANSPLYDMYHHFLHDLQGPTLSKKIGPMTPHLWINDGLMAIFFLLVGLEIKREFVDGRLNTWERRRLPVLAAAAGMIVPALIYLLIVKDDSGLYNGWAIPAATDIAFAIGVLALLGSRAPTALKLFLVTVAIVDDMGAVAIIALVYTAEINGAALLASGVILGIMYTMNKTGVKSLPLYLLFAVALWFAVLMSGIHATIAGVLAAMTIPIVATPGAPDAENSPLHRLEHALHPWSAYLIVPLFGFANAGVSLQGIGVEQVFAPLPLGIAAGLFLGKQIGIFASVWLAIKTGFAPRLGNATWLQVYGVALLCGIGFTMSLFIGALAFPDQPLLIEEAKIGVLMGSLLSAVAGFLILRFAPQPKEDDEGRSIGRSGLKALLVLGSLALVSGCVSTPASDIAEKSVPTTNPGGITALTSAIDQISEDYIVLTLLMDKFEKGYVDAYYGPAKYKEAIAGSNKTLIDAGNQIVLLMEQLDGLPNSDDPMELSRRRFLSAQLEAAHTRHAMITGETLPFVREAKGLFAVKPEIRPLEEFDPILEEIEQLVPGDGPLSARVDAFENGYIIPKEKLQVVFETAIAECKRRTEQYFDLPQSENFKMEFVTDKSWSGYNYYQGNYQSLIQINTDLPIKISRAVDLGCHEGYPGHHVYNMLLEKNLTRGKGWQEFSIYPLYSSQSLIAEGSANYGIDLAFPGVKRLEYEREVLYPLAGLDPDTAGAFWALQIAKQALTGARMTIAQGYLDKEISREDAIAALIKYQLVSRKRAEQSLKFNDDYRSYVINYGLGQDMVRAWIEAQGDAPDQRWKAMERLLSEPMLPGDLVDDQLGRKELENFEVAKKIWDDFVPKSGQAQTVQGELLRAVEKLRDEAVRNGNGNWDEGFEILTAYVEEKLLDEKLFNKMELGKILATLSRIRQFDNPLMDDEPYDYLGDRVVDYFKHYGSRPHAKNPQLKR